MKKSLTIIVLLISSSWFIQASAINGYNPEVTFTCPILNGTYTYGQEIPVQTPGYSRFNWRVRMQANKLKVSNLQWVMSSIYPSDPDSILLSCTSKRVGPSQSLVSVLLDLPKGMVTNCKRDMMKIGLFTCEIVEDGEQ